ncbi:MAG TPA: phosphatidate cytidylyltransferase [Terriglobia bacterium]|nr:phosphatidate cytidylyltransferase [Terriglobia bacterium]
MLKRTLTTLLLIPPVVYLIGWSPKWLFLLAVVGGVVLALREYFALCRAMGYQVFPWIGYVAAAAVCVAQMLQEQFNHAVVAPWLVALLLLIPTFAMWRSRDLKDYLVATSATIFGILYIGLALSCLVPIRFAAHSIGGGGMLRGVTDQPSAGPRPILLLFVVIWAGDICAYLVGRSVGRMPFFARISPRKTWEGSLAGLAASLLAAWAFVHWFWSTIDVKTVMLIAGWVAVAGQVGDLVESAIKRGAHQKDSGTLLPGHGGFLDRIDSLLFAAPALWLAMIITGSLP